MGISLPPININPGYAGAPSTSAPFADAGQAFLQSFLASQAEKGRNSRSSAEMDIEKQKLAFLMAQEKTKQAVLAHHTEVANQQGEATRLFLEHAMPHMAATGQLGQMLSQDPGQQMAQQGVAAASQAQDIRSDQNYQQYVGKMDPEALVGFYKNIVPVLQQVRQQHQREQIMDRFPPGPNETPEQTMGRLRKQTAAYANVGDHQMVASLAESIGALKPDKAEYTWFQKKDGSTVYMPKEEGARLGLGKPTVTSGFGFGPGGPVGVMRALAGIAGMDDADQKMHRFELQVAQKHANLTDWNYFFGQLATLYNEQAKQTGILGHIVPFFGTQVGVAALDHLNRTNPDLANYLQAASQWALEESTLSNKPSDLRTKMDEFVSAIKPNAGVQSIHDVWRSRAIRLHGFQRGVPALQNLLDRAAKIGAGSGPGTTLVVPEEP